MAGGISRGMHYLALAAGPLSAAQFYADQRAKGNSVVGSAAVAGLQTWAFTEFMWPIMAFQLAPLVDVGLNAMNRQTGAMQRNAVPNSAFGIADFTAAQTSRQRGVQAIMESRMNARSSLGNEAGLFAARYR